MKKGITLITLVITIVIMLIVLSTVVVSTVTITNSSKKTTFAKDLKTVEEAVIGEYTTSGVLPIISGTTYSADDIKAMTDSPEKLALELAENGDTSSSFYEVDMTKIGIKKSSRGIKKNGNNNDIYVVSSDNLNIYYPIGVKAGRDKYFSLTSALIKGTKVSKKANEGTGITSSIFANGIRLSKDKKIWTNNLMVTVEITLTAGETASYTVAGTAVTNPVAINTGITKIPLNATTITGGTLTAFNGATQANKKITITKSKAGVADVTATINISNLDIVLPDTAGATAALVANTNENILTFSGMADTAGSGIKEIRYEYVTKLNSSNVDESAYNPQPTIDSAYLETSGKKSNSVNKISLPKHISSIAVTWIDNAGNVGGVKSYTIPVPSLIKETTVNSLDGYIKDGLVLHYDGIDNTGTGHSSTATTWKNLGTAESSDLITENMTVGTNCSWLENGFSITGLSTSGWKKAQKETEVLPEEITYSVTIKTGGDVTTSVIGLIGYSLASAAYDRPALFFETSKIKVISTIAGSIGTPEYVVTSTVDVSANTTYNLVATISRKTKTAKLYINGILNSYITSTTALAVGVPGNSFRLMSYGKADDSGVYSTSSFKGIMYNAKMYNRVLTDKEIKQNYANDIKRFGITE